VTLPSSRAATDEDVFLEARPALVCEPATVEEAAEAMREASRDGSAVAFLGGGTDVALGERPDRLDLLLRTRRLDRIVEHAPSDQIVVVEAGVPLASLNRALAPHGQWLALDPPSPERATVGGAIAANAFGPRRARYGSVRDLLIGISIVRSDGTIARGGGKVVKNVAGFDLPKLMVGSLGTLGLLATASFRLHPLPEISVTLLSPRRTAEEVRDAVGAMREAQLEPASVAALGDGSDRFDLAVRFEGFREGVAGQCERCRSLVAVGKGAAFDVLDPSSASALWKRHDAARSGPAFRAKLAGLPSELPEMAREAIAPLAAALESPAVVAYPTLGLAFVAGEPGEGEAVAGAVAAARAALARSGGSLVLHAAPKSVRSRVGVWGTPPAAIAVMRVLKRSLDPAARLAPGRFVGGI